MRATTPKHSRSSSFEAGPGARAVLWGLAAIAAVAPGCGTTALDVKKVSVAVQPPGNVAMHLKVKRPDGQAVALVASDFKVYEDGKAIPAKKLKRALLPASAVVDRYVLVVLDLSGPLVDSEYLSTLQDVVSSFVERAGKETHLALSVFDGDGLKPFIAFEDAERRAGLAKMRRFRPHNRTIDLWGTFTASLDALDEAARASTASEHTSALVFMTDRKDKAGKHTLDEASARLESSPADVYVLGIGDAISREELQKLARPDAFFVEKLRDLGKPFDQTADRLEAKRGQDYVFSYCSVVKPSKRPSNHKVEVKIETKEVSGVVQAEFTTKAFGKGTCDPRQKVDFASKKADDGAAGDDDAAAGEDADEARPARKSKKRRAPPAEESDDSNSEEG